MSSFREFLGELLKSKTDNQENSNSESSSDSIENQSDEFQQEIANLSNITIESSSEEEEESNNQSEPIGRRTRAQSTDIRVDYNQINLIDPTTKKRSRKIKMAKFSTTDLIHAIPQFNGDQNEIESFISTCDLYGGMLEENQQTLFVPIVISKIKGEALLKLQPINELKTWDDIKKRLEQRLRKPISFDLAQEKINTLRQGRDETIESYGKRFKLALLTLNNASRVLTDNENALNIIRKTNEKLAIRKFQQNMSNEKIK